MMRAEPDVHATPFPESLPAPFQVVTIDVYDPGHTGPVHSHASYQLLVLAAGSFAFLTHDGDALELSPGEAAVLAPGLRHTWLAHGPRPARAVAMLFSPPSSPALADLASVYPARAPMPWWKAGVGESWADELAHYITTESSRKGAFRATSVYARLVELLTRVARSGAARFPELLGSSLPTRLREVLDFIEQHCTRPVTLGGLAARCCLSPSRFSEVFRRYTGDSPVHYLNVCRMRRAEALLHRSDLTVTQIASQLGYPSVHGFSRAFARHTGSPPSAFRDRSHGP